MKAVLAYFQGKFNKCGFEWQTASKCKISLVDEVNGLEGSFVAEYDAQRVMESVQADSGMKPIKKAVPLPPPPPPELEEGGS